MQSCPRNFDPDIAIGLDVQSPRGFDNLYFQDLVSGRGLLSSDQVLFTDSASKSTVVEFANSGSEFNGAFFNAMRKLGRVGVKVGKQGEDHYIIRGGRHNISRHNHRPWPRNSSSTVVFFPSSCGSFAIVFSSPTANVTLLQEHYIIRGGRYNISRHNHRPWPRNSSSTVVFFPSSCGSFAIVFSSPTANALTTVHGYRIRRPSSSSRLHVDYPPSSYHLQRSMQFFFTTLQSLG
ncbi:peroxidase 55 [Senna tora]|uniref:peroxidase n=1 Tax=Senna tora TaxID=362788 RepID=A0A834W0T9_9FABA|nr:peroxidase 55 [Senna tora]